MKMLYLPEITKRGYRVRVAPNDKPWIAKGMPEDFKEWCRDHKREIMAELLEFSISPAIKKQINKIGRWR